MLEGRIVKTCMGCWMPLPFEAYPKQRKGIGGLGARCRACEVERQQIYKHNLTTLERGLIAAAQGGCRICSRPEPGAKGWVVDHDRSCCAGDRSCADCRRGVLCQWCNTAMGYAMDDPNILREMALYLERGPSQWSESVKRVPRLAPTYGDHGQNEESKPLVDHAEVPNATPRKTRLTEGFEALSRPLDEGMTP